MQVLFEVIANIMAFLYGLIPNYAVAIILLTLLVMVATTPLTLKSTRSMLEMQRLQPEMKRLQSQYKDDRQKLNEELLKFYKENDISPLGGCLPLIVQMPVFFVLYQVLHGLTLRVTDSGFNEGWVSGQLATGQPTSTPPTFARVFEPAFVSHDSQLYQNLSTSTTMQAFGLNLAESASQALSQGLLHALPYLLLIVIVGATGFIQQRQITARNQGSSQISSQQQTIMKIMPIFLPVISFGLPAGLVLYFAVSNLYRIGLQWFISRSIYGVGGKGAAGGAAGKGSSGGAPKPSSGGAPKGGSASSGGLKGMLERVAGASSGTDVIDADVVEDDGGSGNGRSRPSKTKVTATSGEKAGGTSAKQRRTAPAKAPGRGGSPASSKKAAASKGAAGAGSPKAKQPSGRTTPAKGAGKASRSGSAGAKASDAKSVADKSSAAKAANGNGSSSTLQPRARKKKS